MNKIKNIFIDTLYLLLIVVLIKVILREYIKLVLDYNENLILILTIIILLVFLAVVIINRIFDLKEREIEFYKEQLLKIDNESARISFLEKIL